MKRIREMIVRLGLLAGSGSFAVADGEILPATVSPSGRYTLASENIYQTEPATPASSLGLGLGSKVSLLGRDGSVISRCFSPSLAYQNIPSRDDWQTKAFWNQDETMVAVVCGGRTWSRVDFYSVAPNRIALLPHPSWSGLLSKNIPGYTGRNTRLYEDFGGWTGNDTFVMKMGGTAVVEESQPEQYPQFGYVVKGRISFDGINLTEIKTGEPIAAGEGDKPSK